MDGITTATIEITHPDQLDVLHEALEAFKASIDPAMWRAVDAAESLLAQVRLVTELG